MAFQHEYNRANDIVMGPYNLMQIILVHGLVAKWKQLVFLEFDKKNDRRIFDECNQ